MKRQLEFKTQGVCSRMVKVEVEDGIVTACEVVGGCSGNTQGVASLVVGMKTDEAVKRLKGIRCGFKDTSCPDQLARAIEEISK
jgi:uncharacterized protein (TIGR03905 family)